MPDTTRPLQVFLSYASQDKSVVQELSRRLIDEGWIDAWLDVKKLLPGQDWRTKIEEAVETSDIVIICLSNNSVTKEGYVQKELRYAREIALEKPEETIFLVPLRLDNCEVPRGLRFYQWVDYFGEKKEESYSALIESLKLRYEQKLNLEEAARARKEKLERETAERIAQENATREKAEKGAAEKARLEAEELARQKAEKEKAERDAKDKFAREQAEKDATEKAHLESEKRARQKSAREKSKRDTASKDKVKQETAEKPTPKAVIRESVEDKSMLEGAETQVSQPKSGNQTVFWVIGFVAVIALAIGLSSLDGNPQSIVAPTSTFAPLASRTSGAIETSTKFFTPTPVVIPTITISPISTDLPTEITDAKGVSMMLIPAGEFTMGGTADQAMTECQKFNTSRCVFDYFLNEEPIHKVYLDDYYMDKYEITNTLYEDCVVAGVCEQPAYLYSKTHPNYFGNSLYDDYPVIHVDWSMAKTFCEWRGARLPTEAEWEKSARGIDGSIYPWGDIIDKNHANYYSNVGDTTEVGSYDAGKSIYSIYDMAGNVMEWVLDWYDENYYANSPRSNPQGPLSGRQHVLRGGGWSSYQIEIRSTNREGWDDYVYIFGTNAIGFRCAKSANP